MDKIELDRFMKAAGIDKMPVKWQNAIKHIYGSYPKECLPQGICDPMYICNVMALELGLGDGRSNFKELPDG